MKRYMLFAGTRMASGGWYDFKGWYATQQEATEDGDDHDWFHVVDMETSKVVAHSGDHDEDGEEWEG